MGQRNWALINTGETFEALVRTLLWFTDPRAILLGRRGVDGGQDARSSDGRRVYQAKHHVNDSAATAIRDALAEATKITAYKTVGHSRYAQWVNVTEWRLQTNVAFNTTDEARWTSEVVPAFKAIGLDATYYDSRPQLEAMLDSNPDVDHAFFGGQTRAFLTLPEARRAFRDADPFSEFGPDVALAGRDSERATIVTFLTRNSPFLLVHGPGGVGKTRLLLEAGEDIAALGPWQVLWAVNPALESAGTWFQAIATQRPTVLLVDEPDSEQLLRQLQGQLSGLMTHWKVVIAVRSPNDPVVRFLRGPNIRRRVDELELTPLSEVAATALCYELICAGPLATKDERWKRDVAQRLAQRYDRFPIWMTLAVHVLADRSTLADVPEQAESLAAQYLEQIVRHGDESSEQRLTTLRWIALLGTLNREDDAALAEVAKRANLHGQAALLDTVRRLVSRRALSQRGANDRLVELKPDVMRDHVLVSWLFIDQGHGEVRLRPSPDADALLEEVLAAIRNGAVTGWTRLILRALGRSEALLQMGGRAARMLHEFFEALRTTVRDFSATRRVTLVELLADVSEVSTSDAVALSRTLRETPADPERLETFFGVSEVGQREVVLEIGWMIFLSAGGARTPEQRLAVLTELVALARDEVDLSPGPEPLPNDGKRAAQLIGRMLQGGGQYWGEFDDAALEVGRDLLNQLSQPGTSRGLLAAATALLAAATSMERTSTTWEENAVTIQRWTIRPGIGAWDTRSELLRAIRPILPRADVADATRRALWRLVADAQGSLHRVAGTDASLNAEIVAELEWVRSYFTETPREFKEYQWARDCWSWYVRFDTDGPRKRLAEEIEALYSRDTLASEFEPLTSLDRHDSWSSSASTKASELAVGDAQSISQFLDRAGTFLNGEINGVLLVAGALGSLAPDSPAVQDFVRLTLQGPSASPRSRFAYVIARTWLEHSRRPESSNSPRAIVERLLESCGDDGQRVGLLTAVYGGLGPPPTPLPAGEELALIRRYASLFESPPRCPSFVSCVTWGFYFEWPELRTILDTALSNTDSNQLPLAIKALVEAVYWGLRRDVMSAAPLPPDLGPWLFDNLLRVGDLDGWGGALQWHLDEILKQLGHMDVPWLARAVGRRASSPALQAAGATSGLPSRMRLSRFVRPLAQADATDSRVIEAIRTLVERAALGDAAGYVLPKYLRDVDPDGVLVPREVISSISAHAADMAVLWRLARVAGAYALASAPWRAIAGSVLGVAQRRVDAERSSLFRALVDSGVTSWSATVGTVPQQFIDRAAKARSYLDDPSEVGLRPFWAWYVDTTAADLRARELEALEDRGE
ncbi:MAG: ATP-binding protein [Polyangiales bacterium]